MSSTAQRREQLKDLAARQKRSLPLQRLRGEGKWIEPHGQVWRCQIAFVGYLHKASRDLLVKQLEKQGVDPRLCWWTDLWKHDLPQGVRIGNDEYATALAYCEDELEIIRPKLTVLIGQHSTAAFFEGHCVTELQGQPYEWDSYMVIPLTYPGVIALLNDKELTEEWNYAVETIAEYLLEADR